MSVYLRGKVPATRVAWEFGTGQQIPEGHVVFRKCESYDCVNPAHLQCGPRRALVDEQASRGLHSTPSKRAAARAANRARPWACLTPELAQWARESRQSSAQAAHGLGVAKSRVIAIRAGNAWVEPNGITSLVGALQQPRQ